MSWRNRKQDIYTNHGKVTTTTIRPATAPGFWRVTQTKQYIGAQEVHSFEGVFLEEEAHSRFDDLVANAVTETVKAPGNGEVLPGVIGDLEDEWGEAV